MQKTNMMATQVKDSRSKVDIHIFLSIAIHKAATNGHLDIVTLLLKDPRVDPNAKDKYGSTGKGKEIQISICDTLQQALHWSASSGHLDIVSLLLKELRVDPNVKDNTGSTGKEDRRLSSLSLLTSPFSFLFNKHFMMLLQKDI
jgi:hypothetical protein